MPVGKAHAYALELDRTAEREAVEFLEGAGEAASMERSGAGVEPT